jgi:hypothetical protein
MVFLRYIGLWGVFLGVVYVSCVDSICLDEELPPPDQLLCSSLVEIIQCHWPYLRELTVLLPSVNLRTDLMDPTWVIAEPFPVLFRWRPWLQDRTYRQVGVVQPFKA